MQSMYNQEVSQESSNALSIQVGTPLKEIEKQVILETLKSERFNRTRTAKVLGIGIRTLQRKLKLYAEPKSGDSESINETNPILN